MCFNFSMALMNLIKDWDYILLLWKLFPPWIKLITWYSVRRLKDLYCFNHNLSQKVLLWLSRNPRLRLRVFIVECMDMLRLNAIDLLAFLQISSSLSLEEFDQDRPLCNKSLEIYLQFTHLCQKIFLSWICPKDKWANWCLFSMNHRIPPPTHLAIFSYLRSIKKVFTSLLKYCISQD